MSQEKSKHSKNLFFKFLKICFLCFGFVTFVPAAYSVSLGSEYEFFSHYFPNFAVLMWTSKLLIQVDFLISGPILRSALFRQSNYQGSAVGSTLSLWNFLLI